MKLTIRNFKHNSLDKYSISNDTLEEAEFSVNILRTLWNVEKQKKPKIPSHIIIAQKTYKEQFESLKQTNHNCSNY